MNPSSPPPKSSPELDSSSPRAAVLVLHGGKESDTSPSRPWHLSRVRMQPFIRALKRSSTHYVGIDLVKYRVRGWNGPQQSPVHDAKRALEASLKKHGPIPHILVGHSMGGRVAAVLAANPRLAPHIAGVVALAPWWPDGEGTFINKNTQVRVLHGLADNWTSPEQSREQVHILNENGVDATWLGLPDAGHFMFKGPRTWHNFVTHSTSKMVTGLSSQPTQARLHSEPPR